MMVPMIALLIIFPLVGLVARRWLTPALPLIGWPLSYVGLNRGWWGEGTGDGWPYAAALLTAIGVLTTAVAIAGARFVPRPRFNTHGTTSR